ncbi:tyrosine-type recombinase/integrase [Ferrimicrobium acidiphilum]|uniref:Tyrosine-type recombinase/integrase n=1 Tax=Ferrimicrobium acidiphilum TaxID=121039 RepID=A0ABV3Y5P4_9ACTN
MKQDDRFFCYVRDFLLVYLPKNRCFSQNTVNSYRDCIQLLCTFITTVEHGLAISEITFDQLSPDLIGEFLNWLHEERHCSASTQNQRLAALKSLFKYAAQRDISLMASYLELSKVPPKRVAGSRVSYLSENALAALLRQPNEKSRLGIRDRFFMVLLYDTGARIQEILDLHLTDLHLDDAVPCVYLTGKGQKTRAVPLLSKTVQHLELYMERFHGQKLQNPEDLLFYTVIKGKTGKMSPDNVSCFINRYAKSARCLCPEVPERVHPHLFRHTRAMHLYQAGMPLSYIKDFLGHASVNTTDVYAAADLTMMKRALEKAYVNDDAFRETPIWQDNEILLMQLSGMR